MAPSQEDIIRWYQEDLRNSQIDIRVFSGISAVSFVVYIVISWRLVKNNYTQMQIIMKRAMCLTFLLLLMMMIVNCGAAIFLNNASGWGIISVYFMLQNICYFLNQLLIILTYKVLLNLKRVEIQMNENYKTTGQVITALKRQICIDRLILGFYGVFLFIQVIGMVLIYTPGKEESQVM